MNNLHDIKREEAYPILEDFQKNAIAAFLSTREDYKVFVVQTGAGVVFELENSWESRRIPWTHSTMLGWQADWEMYNKPKFSWDMVTVERRS